MWVEVSFEHTPANLLLTFLLIPLAPGHIRLYTYGTSYLPSMLQLGLLMLIPVIVQFVSTNLEGCVSGTEVQSAILSRYFMFQMANVSNTTKERNAYQRSNPITVTVVLSFPD